MPQPEGGNKFPCYVCNFYKLDTEMGFKKTTAKQTAQGIKIMYKTCIECRQNPDIKKILFKKIMIRNTIKNQDQDSMF
jgi:hypothetical protein